MNKIAIFRADSGGNYESILEVKKIDNQVELFIHPIETEDIGGSIRLPIPDVHNLINFLQEISNFQDLRRN